LLPPRTTFLVNSSDYHIASFTKPTPTSSYVQGNNVVYVLSPPPTRSPPIILPPAIPQVQVPINSGPTMSLFTGPSLPVSPSLDAQSSSFTNTFLRGILSSIDSKDPVVANAWLETLLDAIDLLPADVIKREIVVIAVSKAQIEQTVNSRKAACRLIGKISCKLDPQTVRQEILPVALALCQDAECEVRHCMCCHLGFVAHGVGSEVVEANILPQLVDLGNDENCEVRLAAVEAVVHLLGLLDKDLCMHTIVPLVIKSCERAKRLEDETLPKIAHLMGQLCHGLMSSLSGDQKSWFLNFYRHLAQLGLSQSRDNSLKKRLKNEPQPMPDLLPPMEADK
jgi:serine/threonine-protein phosphatase 4 regulatory subunit 4